MHYILKSKINILKYHYVMKNMQIYINNKIIKCGISVVNNYNKITLLIQLPCQFYNTIYYIEKYNIVNKSTK